MKFNQIVQGDAAQELARLDAESVDLYMTSPPYNAGLPYEPVRDENEYRDFIVPVIDQIKRTLKPDGRFCVNVCFSINRITENDEKIVLFPYLTWTDELRKAGLHIKENIVWDQLDPGCRTAWGSFQRASAPHIRKQTEYIIVGYKDQWGKLNYGTSTISSREFTRWTLDLWKINYESDRSHPAPYPEEIPLRCIKLFSYLGDVVVDPYVGSGTTCAVAKKCGRQYFGIDLNADYCEHSRRRIANIPEKLEKFFNA